MGERRRDAGGPALGNGRVGSAAWARAVGVEARLGRLASRAQRLGTVAARALSGGGAAGGGRKGCGAHAP
jgi:hypothetical protein